MNNATFDVIGNINSDGSVVEYENGMIRLIALVRLWNTTGLSDDIKSTFDLLCKNLGFSPILINEVRFFIIYGNEDIARCGSTLTAIRPLRM